MDVLLILIPVALLLGLLGLGGFIWALKSGQFEDLDGAAVRILIDDEPPSEDPEQGAAGPQSPPPRTSR
jgi:cbb3-type cytochrome oxidase maturation protein